MVAQRHSKSIAVSYLTVLQMPCLQDGIAALVDIYMGVVGTLTQERGLRVVIHPVPPAVPDALPFVLAFQQQLQQAVREHNSRLPRQKQKLHLLDCFHDMVMVQEAGGELCLRPELALEGAHLSPAYLQCVQRALNQLITNMEDD